MFMCIAYAKNNYLKKTCASTQWDKWLSVYLSIICVYSNTEYSCETVRMLYIDIFAVVRLQRVCIYINCLLNQGTPVMDRT